MSRAFKRPQDQFSSPIVNSYPAFDLTPELRIGVAKQASLVVLHFQIRVVFLFQLSKPIESLLSRAIILFEARLNFFNNHFFYIERRR